MIESDKIILESDTVMNCIYDIEYDGHAEIHFTSMYDSLISKWVPVLISIVLGGNKNIMNHIFIQCLSDLV